MSDLPSLTALHSASGVKSEPKMRNRIPSLIMRAGACTHTTMERLYGNHQCDMCNRPSLLGWVYICTQDAYDQHDSHAVDEDRSGTTSNQQDKNDFSQPTRDPDFEPDFRMPTPEIAPGLEKAIKNGLYSPEQAGILRAQKRKVVEMAYATIENFQRERDCDDVPHRPSLVRSNHTTAKEDDGARDPVPSPMPELRLFPYCRYQVCHACRPLYRDRAWQSFEDVYAKDASIIIESENLSFYNTRPLISRKILQDIGRGHLSRSASSSLDAVTLEPQDITDTNLRYESEVRSVRESMRRRLLKGLSGRESSLSGKKRRFYWEPRTSLDTVLWKTVDDNMLEEAATIPLPEQDITEFLASDDDDVEHGELEKGDSGVGKELT